MTSPLADRPILRMNGIGNEILVLDLRGAAHELAPAEARAIARAPGLRFDQLMALHAPRGDGRQRLHAHLQYRRLALGRLRQWHALRRLMRSAKRARATRCCSRPMRGSSRTWRRGETLFSVDMGRPRLDWRAIPLAGEGADTSRVALTPPVAGAPAVFSAVNMGNPHAVFFVEDPEAVDLAALGPAIEHHPLFPERVNVSFAQCARAGRDSAARLGARDRRDAGLRLGGLRDAGRGGARWPDRRARRGCGCRAAISISTGARTIMW